MSTPRVGRPITRRSPSPIRSASPVQMHVVRRTRPQQRVDWNAYDDDWGTQDRPIAVFFDDGEDALQEREHDMKQAASFKQAVHEDRVIRSVASGMDQSQAVSSPNDKRKGIFGLFSGGRKSADRRRSRRVEAIEENMSAMAVERPRMRNGTEGLQGAASNDTTVSPLSEPSYFHRPNNEIDPFDVDAFAEDPFSSPKSSPRGMNQEFTEDPFFNVSAFSNPQRITVRNSFEADPFVTKQNLSFQENIEGAPMKRLEKHVIQRAFDDPALDHVSMDEDDSVKEEKKSDDTRRKNDKAPLWKPIQQSPRKMPSPKRSPSPRPEVPLVLQEKIRQPMALRKEASPSRHTKQSSLHRWASPQKTAPESKPPIPTSNSPSPNTKGDAYQGRLVRRAAERTKHQQASTWPSPTSSAPPKPKITSRSIYSNKDTGIVKPRAPALNTMFPTVQSVGTSESQTSLGSDYRRLRSILRRSRQVKDTSSESTKYSEPLQSAFALYGTPGANDPMQRAGLRLLSAAVVPIQTAVRRHLAVKEALARIDGVVTIQTYVRRWRTQRLFQAKRFVAIKIQSKCRIEKARRAFLIQKRSAVEIQRFVRGYLATMLVYETIYYVTILQSYIRRKLAIEHATDRMVLVLRLQALARGYLWRRHMIRMQTSAIMIQTHWRKCSCRFNYQLDLLDIVSVQSIVRRHIVMRKVNRENAAIVIQKYWRSYDCTMNYLHFVADVIIVQSAARRWIIQKQRNLILSSIILQSAVRRWLALKDVTQKKVDIYYVRNYKATLIQKTWRGFICYADFMFTIADIVTVQTLARKWLANMKVNEMRRGLGIKQETAAILIQKNWRRFIQQADFFIQRCENRAATIIQSYWRRFYAYSSHCIALGSAVRIQAGFRGFLAFRLFEQKLGSALIIQAAVRSHVARRSYVAKHKVDMLSMHVLDTAYEELGASISIQKIWRGRFQREHFRNETAAVKIQGFWNQYTRTKSYLYHSSARKIQSAWRGMLIRSCYMLYISARKIQSSWRGYIQRNSYVYHISAVKIQKIWRGEQIRMYFLESIAAIRIQSFLRMTSAREQFVLLRNEVFKDKIDAAIVSQKIWRGYKVRSSGYKFTRWLDRQKIQQIAAEEIQRAWRGYYARAEYWHQLGTLIELQAVVRGYLSRVAFYRHVEALVKIQSTSRMFRVRKDPCISPKIKKHLSPRAVKMDKDKAARVIQRFFIMVRNEVDREIQKAKIRRKLRKKSKKIKKSVDEEESALEYLWTQTMDDTIVDSESFHHRSRINGVHHANHFSDLTIARSRKGPRDPDARRIPDTYYQKPMRGRPAFKQYCVDDGSKIISIRSKMAKNEREEDYHLETAWIDAGIEDAKGRRRRNERRKVPRKLTSSPAFSSRGLLF